MNSAVICWYWLKRPGAMLRIRPKAHSTSLGKEEKLMVSMIKISDKEYTMVIRSNEKHRVVFKRVRGYFKNTMFQTRRTWIKGTHRYRSNNKMIILTMNFQFHPSRLLSLTDFFIRQDSMNTIHSIGQLFFTFATFSLNTLQI